jgi:nucleoside-diphosphate-sugar epimerase
VRAHEADLFDAAAVAETIERARPSHLLHLTWTTEPGSYWATPENVRWLEASLSLLRAFAVHGGERVVMAGTCAEYDWGEGICRENVTPLRPASLYGACKNALRDVSEALASRLGLRAAWGRVFFLYGPHEHPQRLVASVIASLLRGQPALCSEGTQRRDFLHVQDVADAFVELLQSDLSGPVNLASGEAVSVRSVVEGIADQLGARHLLRLGARLLPLGEPPLVVADVARLRQELRWAPRLSLQAGLAQTVEWWRSRPMSRRAA